MDLPLDLMPDPGASAECARVPPPTAATTDALRTPRVGVAGRREKLKIRARASVYEVLSVLLLASENPWSKSELERNALGISGCVVRRVDKGIGCSKLPDINDVRLTEDLASCCISSQHIVDGLHHGIMGEDQVRATMQHTVAMVDRQNADGKSYRDRAPDFDECMAFRAACNLVFTVPTKPNSYTGSVLYARRREAKEGAVA